MAATFPEVRGRDRSAGARDRREQQTQSKSFQEQSNRAAPGGARTPNRERSREPGFGRRTSEGETAAPGGARAREESPGLDASMPPESISRGPSLPVLSYSEGVYGDGPAWVPDKEAPDCGVCHERFTKNLVKPRRRHHCRLCGVVVCQACSESRVEFQGKLERACTRCCQAALPLNKMLPFLNDLDARLNNISANSDGGKDPKLRSRAKNGVSGKQNSQQLTPGEEDVLAIMARLNEAASKLEEAFHSRNQSFAASSPTVGTRQVSRSPKVGTRPPAQMSQAPSQQEEEPAAAREVMDFSVGEDEGSCKCTSKCVIS